jgi:hypothetical protein
MPYINLILFRFRWARSRPRESRGRRVRLQKRAKLTCKCLQYLEVISFSLIGKFLVRAQIARSCASNACARFLRMPSWTRTSRIVIRTIQRPCSVSTARTHLLPSAPRTTTSHAVHSSKNKFGSLPQWSTLQKSITFELMFGASSACGMFGYRKYRIWIVCISLECMLHLKIQLLIQGIKATQV